MTTPFRELVLASHNDGKIRELRDLLAPLAITVLSAKDLALPEPEETGDSFEANAAIKAESAAQATGKTALADDSGLAIPALEGAPGIYSARWAGAAKDFTQAMERVHLELMESGTPPEGASAFFVCVLALAAPDKETQFFRGEIHGHLTFPPRGDKGFGYDPIFIPHHPQTPDQQTFAEIDPQLKHRISHRGTAFRLFLDYLQPQAA